MRICCWLLFGFLNIGNVWSQEVSNINPKVRILGGEAYYIHNVLAGQSIEAIAKAYVSTPAMILKQNPTIATIREGMKLRIPYNDESALVMSKYDLKLDDELSAKVYDGSSQSDQPVQTSAEPEPITEKKEEKPTELSAEDQKALEELNALSSELRTSMNSLKSAEEKVKSKPVLADDGLPKKEIILPADETTPMKGVLLSEFLEAQVQPMLRGEHPSGANVLLKEYFLVRINDEGIITNVRDERTEMNGNTFLLEPDTLKGFQLVADPSTMVDQFHSIGLVAQINRDTIPVKFKQKGIKYLNETPSSKTVELITAYQEDKKLWGKHDVVVAEAKYYLATFGQLEYNPFGEIRRKIYFNGEKRVTKAILK